MGPKMDTGKLIDELLASGKHYLDKGKQLAEEQINLPKEGSERDAKLDGLKKGALAAGGLALLLGTGAGRRLTGSALKLGSLAALGGIAYKAYQNWQGAKDATPVQELTGPAAEARNTLLLRAMIAAAKADGHIDVREQAHIEAELKKMNLADTESEFFQHELGHSLDIDAIAAAVDSKPVAAEVYLASRIVMNIQNNTEKAYLDELASKLGLNAEEVTSLESQIT